jgi:hypothetical protein
MQATMIQQIESASKATPNHLGVQVGVLCIRGNVPLSFVQGVIDTSHVTVYRWVTGTVRPQNRADVRKLARLKHTLTAAIEQGILPQDKFDSEQVLPLWAASKAAIQS